MKEMPQSCAKINSSLPDGDLPSKEDGVQGGAPQSQPHHHAAARAAMVCSDAEGCVHNKRNESRDLCSRV